MQTIEFDALDLHTDQSFVTARYRYEGDERRGFRVERNGRLVVQLGPGFRLLRVRQCGVCSTDLARHLLPFPLPQVIGHEVVAVDGHGRRFVVEINASHAARGVDVDCAFCRAGLPTHCPERTTLGIDTLPGGFGPWILAPVGACIEVPAALPDSAAVLVEPFAAALHAVHTVAPRPGERIAVLGPRRLGMLVVAALAGERARRGTGAGFAIAALVRDPALLPFARGMGATEVHRLDGPPLPDSAFDVVIDTTGSPDGLDLAVRLARREVHLKSTHGRPAAGLRHATELVVDELSIARLPVREPGPGAAPWDRLRTGRTQRVAWLAREEPPSWLTARAEVCRGAAADLAALYELATEGLPRADVAVASSPDEIDAVIRPRAGRECSLLRPRGDILVPSTAAGTGSALLDAVVARDLRLSSSRCGDFRAALRLLAGDPDLVHLLERFVTHRFPASALPAAFTAARSRGCIKAVVVQDANASH